MITVNIVGWTLVVSSWTIPTTIKNKSIARVVGLVLAGMASGVFIGGVLGHYCI